MAKRTAPSLAFDSTLRDHSPADSTPDPTAPSASLPPHLLRVTRSAARRAAAEGSPPAADPPAPPTTSPPRSTRSTRKRKASLPDQTPEAPTSEPTPAGVQPPRRSKRQRVEEPVAPPPEPSSRTRRTWGSMSTNAPDGQEPENIPATQSSKKKPSKSKKPAPETPSNPQPGRRQKKNAKADDTPAQTGESSSKATPLPMSRRRRIRNFMDGHGGSSGNNHDGEEDDDDDAAEDPLRSGILGRPDPDSLGIPRGLSGYSSYGSSAAHRIRELTVQLQKKEDPSIQVIALTELSQYLLMANEDMLTGNIAADALVKELVTLMQPNEFTGEENPEMMLLACRCIANLIEASPSTTRNVIHNGAVPVLCQKLFEIQYIDVAEQALSTLEKISIAYGGSIIEAGGLTACLNYLDFFATSTQRSAVTTAANCCRSIPSGSFSVVRDAMPVLLNVLGSNDQKVVEQGSICVCHIIKSFRGKQEKLEELVKPKMLRAILRLLVPGTTNLIGPNVHTKFLRVLAVTASASPTLAAELFRMDVVDTLYQILTGVSPPDHVGGTTSNNDGVVIMQALIHRPKEQVQETLNVVCELLPGVQNEKLAVSDALLSSGYMYDEFVNIASNQYGNSTRQERLDRLAKCPDKVKRFVTILLPTLVHAYSSTVNLNVRRKVLAAQLKLLSNIDTSILEDALRAVPFASYLASMLSQQDHPSLSIAALQAAELLSSRLGNIYLWQFCREGVIAEITKLANQPLLSHNEKKKEPKAINKGDGAPKSAEKADSPPEPAAPDYEVSESDGDEEHDHGEDDDDDDDDDGNEEGEHLVVHEDISRSPSSSSSGEDAYSRPPSLDRSLRHHVALQAKKYLEKHQTADNQKVWNDANGILEDVKALGQRICNWYQAGGAVESGPLFKELAAYFGDDALKSITSAELLNSNIIDVLLDVLDGGNEGLNFDAKEVFAERFMCSESQKPPTSLMGTSNSTAFSVLVHKLQDLLSRCEHFEVFTVGMGPSDSGRSSSLSSMLSRQVRLKLVADRDSVDIPPPYQACQATIHAIATFRALDEFLRPRFAVRTSRDGSSGRPRYPDGMPSSLAAFAAASGMTASRRFIESAMAATLSESSQPPPPPPVEPTPKSSSRKSSKDKLAANQPPPAPATESTPSQRSTRRHKPSSAPSKPPPPQPAESSQEVLECADEHQLSDEEDDMDDPSALNAFVDDLEDDMSRTPPQDPTAVNMEVASSGKVTAREENGARIPTPASQNAGLSLPQAVSGGPPPPPAIRAALSSTSTPTPASRAMSYAQAIKEIPQDFHLEFSLNGKVLSGSMTIYRALHGEETSPDDPQARRVWQNVHAVQMKKVQGPPPPEASLSAQWADSIPAVGEDGLPKSLQTHPTSSKIMRLLKLLHDLNASTEENVPTSVARGPLGLATEPPTQFVNTKLTAKLNRQLEEPLIVASKCLPAWSLDLPRFYPFLFPYETRYLFLSSTSFGYARAMGRWQAAQAADDARHDHHHRRREPGVPRIQRQKVRISRSRILDSALKVLELYSASGSILEVEYFEEVGTGLGPTLEFYATVSREFCRKKNGMWRADGDAASAVDPDGGADAAQFAFSPQGLFPAPMNTALAQTEAGKRVLYLWRMLGKFVARGMLDGRIVDIAFSPMFFKLSVGSPSTVASGKGPLDSDALNDITDGPLSLATVKAVDPRLASSLRLVWQFVQSQKVLAGAGDATTRARLAENLMFDGVRIEDLGLDFTLPGYPFIELAPNGANVPVTLDNVAEYLHAVVDMTVGSGVKRQMDEFRAGFSSVFPYAALTAFSPAELVTVFGRTDEDWLIETLMDSIKADHGFNMDSKSVRNLLQTMSDLDKAQRRDFLQFVTGSPKLPIGGFKALTPMFTVVCKPSEPPYASDDYLPSVMTCVNYLKLPDYSSLDVMKQRLFVAIKEGQGAFHLS